MQLMSPVDLKGIIMIVIYLIGYVIAWWISFKKASTANVQDLNRAGNKFFDILVASVLAAFWSISLLIVFPVKASETI